MDAMERNFSFCGLFATISLEAEKHSFFEQLEASEFTLLPDLAPYLRVLYDECEYELNTDEDHETLFMMAEDGDAESECFLQMNIQIDASSIDPDKGSVMCWVNNFEELVGEVEKIAPKSKFEYELTIMDDVVTNDDEFVCYAAMGEELPLVIAISNVQPKIPPVVDDPNELREVSRMNSMSHFVLARDEDSENDMKDDLTGSLSVSLEREFPDGPDDGLLGNISDVSLWSESDEDDVGLQQEEEQKDDSGEILLPIPLDLQDDEIKEEEDPQQPQRERISARMWDRELASIIEVAEDVPIPPTENLDEIKSDYDPKDVAKDPALFLELCRTREGASFLINKIPNKRKDGFKPFSLKRLIKTLCEEDNIRIVGEDWYGSQVIRALLTNKRFIKNLVDAIRMKCVELKTTAAGAFTVQHVLETSGKDESKKLGLLNILLERAKTEKHLRTLLNMVRHRHGSILVQVALSTVSHAEGHKYICEILADIPPEQLKDLALHHNGYMFVQALLCTYLAKKQEHRHKDNCHDRIFGALKEVIRELLIDDRGLHVLLMALKFSPTIHASYIREELQRDRDCYERMKAIFESTPGGPGPTFEEFLAEIDIAPPPMYGGGEAMSDGVVVLWDGETGQGDIRGNDGQMFRFYKNDLVGVEAEPGARVAFQVSGTGTATNIVVAGV